MNIQASNPPRLISPATRKFALNLAAIWLAWAIAVTVAYYHTNIVFLRAESGWYQAISQTVHRHHFLPYFTESYHGHYTPFVFAAEIELSHWLGPRETLWKWRQLTGLVILATCLSATVYAAARSCGHMRWNAVAVAAGITALFVFQPHMLEFVAWPVLIFFLSTLIFSTLALLALVQLARNPAQRKWIWLAAATAYLSMHCTGLGLINVVVTAALFAGLLAGVYSGRFEEFSSSRRTLLVALVALLLVAGLHALCMQFLRTPVPGGPKMGHLQFSLVFGFIAAVFFSACQAILVFRLLPEFHAQLILSLWPWGIFLLLSAATLLVVLVRGCMRAPSAGRLVQLVLHAFSIVAFAAFIFLAMVRSVAEPYEDWTLGYLLSSRYLVMANFTLFGSVSALALSLGRNAGKFCAPIFVMLCLTVFAANKQYARSAFPKVGSNFVVSHGKAWRAITAMTRECRAANLPVPDAPMRMVSQFDWPLHYYEPLLRYSLKLKPDEKIAFVQWKELDAVTQERYHTAAPSLRRVFSVLRAYEN